MTSYATQLGKTADAERFAKLAEDLKNALNEKFYDPERGYYDNGSQTSCVLPLAFDMVPPDQRGRVFDRLVKKITGESKGHVGTGLIGGQWLNRVLTEGGREDLVYGFATNSTYPGWGYMVEQGATTIWELWNGNTADPAMNSGNHVMLVGDFIIWLYEDLAGIKSDPEKPGFKHILMRPQPVGDLSWVRASHDSPHGRITSDWKIVNGLFRWKIIVPANATATVFLPVGDAAQVKEGGIPLARADGVKILKPKDGKVHCDVVSGTYEFEFPWPD
jgi:alpha-L-rhamnosidase